FGVATGSELSDYLVGTHIYCDDLVFGRFKERVEIAYRDVDRGAVRADGHATRPDLARAVGDLDGVYHLVGGGIYDGDVGAELVGDVQAVGVALREPRAQHQHGANHEGEYSAPGACGYVRSVVHVLLPPTW